MLLSKSCIYGLRAMLYLSLEEQGENYVSIRRIADDLDISFHFLTKILQTLTQNHLLTSFRGPNGGVSLARSAHSISLIEVITAIDGTGVFTACILGLNGCGEAEPCPLHDQWSTARSQIRQAFEAMNLADLAIKTKDLNLRLVDSDWLKLAA